VVFSDGGGPHTRDLYIVRKQGGVWTAPILLTAASSFDHNSAPALSPDGTQVIFDAGADASPSTAIGEVGVGGNGFHVLVTNTDGPPGQTSTEAFSGSRAPDGSLVFEAEWAPSGLSERIWRQPAAGGAPALVNGSFGNDNSPCVLPGSRIASLYLDAAGADNGLHEIKIMGADGSNAFLLTHNGFIPGFTEVDDIGMGCGPQPVSGNAADLAVAQSDSPDPVSSGGSVTYAVIVTNHGPSAASSVTLTDTLPTGGSLISFLPGPPTCSASPGTLTCNLGGLGVNASAGVSILVQAGASGSLTNVASVSGVPSDPLPGNNTSTETTLVFSGPLGELVHGSSELRNLASLPGPTPAEGLFHIHQAPEASLEIVVDATAGEIGNGAGPSLERVDSSGTLQQSVPLGAGSSRSLRFENATASAVDDQWIRVRSNGCTTSCGPEAVYRIRAYDTTYRIARFNNSASQATVLAVQNTGAVAVTGTLWFWDANGSSAGQLPISLGPQEVRAVDTTAIAPNTGGSVTLSNDGSYGVLAGKAVAIEPATGFSFDTPLEPRPR
jgi:uncharacterized repeat protein (TIGR01451 family)